MYSKGRGFDFDVNARLEHCTTTHSSILPKLFPKISKSLDCKWVFYCFKWRPGTKYDIWSVLFWQKPTFFKFFSLESDQILDPWQNLLIITFFAGKRCGGVCICPKGLISTKIFALALTVREIFGKNHFQKNWRF